MLLMSKSAMTSSLLCAYFLSSVFDTELSCDVHLWEIVFFIRFTVRSNGVSMYFSFLLFPILFRWHDFCFNCTGSWSLLAMELP